MAPLSSYISSISDTYCLSHARAQAGNEGNQDSQGKVRNSDRGKTKTKKEEVALTQSQRSKYQERFARSQKGKIVTEQLLLHKNQN
jgi:hypothetical protein